MKPVHFLYFMLIFEFSNAQSLIVNGGFEEMNTCTEFNAKCAPEAWFRIPATELSLFTEISAKSGAKKAGVAVANKNHPTAYRSYLYTMLLCPLEKGETYIITFYLNPIHEKQFELGILLSQNEIISGIDDPLSFTAQKTITATDAREYDKRSKWYKIETEYIAQGGERFIYFGNFKKEANVFGPKTVFNNKLGDLIYLLDDISLKPRNQENFIYCDEYDRNKTLLYSKDHRHTDKIGILPQKDSEYQNGAIDNGNE